MTWKRSPWMLWLIPGIHLAGIASAAGGKLLVTDLRDIAEALRSNQDKPFVRRILDPGSAPDPLMKDGFKDTHRMAAEVDEDGQWYAFPTVIEQDGQLVRYEDAYEALRANKKTGNLIPFDSKEQAIKFSQQYKTPKFLEYYK